MADRAPSGPQTPQQSLPWCETCQSWRHTKPCGRADCPFDAATHYHYIATALDNAVANGCMEELSKMSDEDIAYDLAQHDAGCERLEIGIITAAVRAWRSPQAKHDCGPDHRWADNFEYGDTCLCGAWYLLRDTETGGVKIQEATTCG